MTIGYLLKRIFDDEAVPDDHYMAIHFAVLILASLILA